MTSAKYNKYGVSDKKSRTYNGKVYDSKKESEYRKKLDLLKRSANIKDRPVNIEEQVRYDFVHNGVKICSYILDFRVTYCDRVDYIDVKGYKAGPAYQTFKTKKKMMKAFYKIDVIEV